MIRDNSGHLCANASSKRGRSWIAAATMALLASGFHVEPAMAQWDQIAAGVAAGVVGAMARAASQGGGHARYYEPRGHRTRVVRQKVYVERAPRRSRAARAEPAAAPPATVTRTNAGSSRGPADASYH